MSSESLELKAPILSVGEVSLTLKRMVEDTFSRVRVRGEVSGVKRHTSGHIYFALKDDQAVLDSVCWRGVAARLKTLPTEGAEVICTGRLTTYPGRSKYQITVEQLELAGEGALLKLLEERKRKLAAEGLFEAERKKSLPFLPQCIGIVTSPTGAVIQDILHRLEDRFPRPVLVWPVAVQGETAPEQVSQAIRGFNTRLPSGTLPRPDLLIVARGGGSLEDLWAFNEEVVVRAAAESEIPLISAVGHETDTTLIDYASDWRAPTPTAAAEKAVPVRDELQAWLQEQTGRLSSSLGRMVNENFQRLDDRGERFQNAGLMFLDQKSQQVLHLKTRLRHPKDLMRDATQSLKNLEDRLRISVKHSLTMTHQSLESLGKLLHSYSYQQTLERGFSVVKDAQGRVVKSVRALTPHMPLSLTFYDGEARAEALPSSSRETKSKTSPTPRPRKKPRPKDTAQKTLWD